MNGARLLVAKGRHRYMEVRFGYSRPYAEIRQLKFQILLADQYREVVSSVSPLSYSELFGNRKVTKIIRVYFL